MAKIGKAKNGSKWHFTGKHACRGRSQPDEFDEIREFNELELAEETAISNHTVVAPTGSHRDRHNGWGGHCHSQIGDFDLLRDMHTGWLVARMGYAPVEWRDVETDQDCLWCRKEDGGEMASDELQAIVCPACAHLHNENHYAWSKKSQWADSDHRSLNGDYTPLDSREQAKNQGQPSVTTSEKKKYTEVEIFVGSSDAFLLTEGVKSLNELISDAIKRCEEATEYNSDPSPHHNLEGFHYTIDLLPRDVQWFKNQATTILSNADYWSPSHPVFQ